MRLQTLEEIEEYFPGFLDFILCKRTKYIKMYRSRKMQALPLRKEEKICSREADY